jgi:hypothetical protein
LMLQCRLLFLELGLVGWNDGMLEKWNDWMVFRSSYKVIWVWIA